MTESLYIMVEDYDQFHHKEVTIAFYQHREQMPMENIVKYFLPFKRTVSISTVLSPYIELIDLFAFALFSSK